MAALFARFALFGRAEPGRRRKRDGVPVSGRRVCREDGPYAQCGMSSRAANPRTKNARVMKPYATAAYLCGYCGVPFEARRQRTAGTGRYCSGSCKQMAYQQRRRRAAKREAARAAILAGVGL